MSFLDIAQKYVEFSTDTSQVGDGGSSTSVSAGGEGRQSYNKVAWFSQAVAGGLEGSEGSEGSNGSGSSSNQQLAPIIKSSLEWILSLVSSNEFAAAKARTRQDSQNVASLEREQQALLSNIENLISDITSQIEKHQENLEQSLKEAEKLNLDIQKQQEEQQEINKQIEEAKKALEEAQTPEEKLEICQQLSDLCGQLETLLGSINQNIESASDANNVVEEQSAAIDNIFSTTTTNLENYSQQSNDLTQQIQSRQQEVQLEQVRGLTDLGVADTAAEVKHGLQVTKSFTSVIPFLGVAGEAAGEAVIAKVDGVHQDFGSGSDNFIASYNTLKPILGNVLIGTNSGLNYISTFTNALGSYESGFRRSSELFSEFTKPLIVSTGSCQEAQQGLKAFASLVDAGVQQLNGRGNGSENGSDDKGDDSSLQQIVTSNVEDMMFKLLSA